MRFAFNSQKPLFCQWPDHKYSHELREISAILRDLPEIILWVYDDINRNVSDTECGPKGISAEQTLRAAILKQQNSWSYETLALQSLDSSMTRAFLHLNEYQGFSKSCLQENISKISDETWQSINDHIVQYAADKGFEKGRTVRMDATVIQTNIHPPSDSSLIFDCVRIAKACFKIIRKKMHKNWYISVPVKETKILMLKVLTAKSQQERKSHYRKLIKIARDLQRDLKNFKRRLDNKLKSNKCRSQVDKLAKILDVLPKIIYQAKRRVIDGKPVPSGDKIVSIFEDHTDIIVKGRREVEFGHKVYITAGRTGLVLDCSIVKGNPSDPTMFVELLDKQKKIYDRVPRQTSADGGFASLNNLRTAKTMGVKDVCFSKRCGLKKEEMAKSIWVFDNLRKFRAGIEGVISVLKRAFGCSRIVWKGWGGFKSAVQSSIVAYNLTLLGRLRLSPQ